MILVSEVRSISNRRAKQGSQVSGVEAVLPRQYFYDGVSVSHLSHAECSTQDGDSTSRETRDGRNMKLKGLMS